MNGNITKPMSVVRQELIEQLVDNINNCPLPLFVVEYVLQDILNTVKATAQEQCKLEKAQYELQLNKQKEASSNQQKETSSNNNE